VAAQANQAGPGPRRDDALPIGSEAAGPASPRLVIEEVSLRLRPDLVEAHTSLRLGSYRFTGAARGPAGPGQTWQLAAAASVAALQQYLQQCATGPSTPQLQLLDITATSTAIGQEVIHATVRLSHGSNQSDLLGSALVRNDRCSTAVAAALDATSRPLARFRLSSSLRSSEQEALPEPATTPLDSARGGARLSGVEAPPANLTHEVPQIAYSPELAAPRLDGAAPEAPPLPDRLFPSPARARPVSMRNGARARSPAHPAPPPRRGSPAAAVVGAHPPRSHRAVTLGAVLGASSIRVGAVDSSGRIVIQAHRPAHPAGTPTAVLTQALEAVREIMAGLNSTPHQLAGLGLAAPGELQVTEGVCLSCGEFPAWRDVQLTAPFSEEFHLPVFLLGTTQAAALAEVRFGAAQGLSSLLFVRVNAEIDLALIVNEQPLYLPQVSPGRAGHMVIETAGPACSCGESGCWQALAGRDALLARVLKGIRSGAPSAVGAAVGNRFGAITPELIVRTATAGDAVARRALEETGRYLAIGLANLVALFGPEGVIVHSLPAPVGRALLQAAEATLKFSPRSRLLSHCVLLSPWLGESAPLLGAAAWAAQCAV